MKKHSSVEIIVHDFEKHLNNIFDCDQKIKSLLSDLRAISIEMEMLRHLVQAHNPQIEVNNDI